MTTPNAPDHIAELTDYVRTLPPAYGRKLVFSQKCGLAFALKAGMPPWVIEEAFGLSRTGISYLKTCLDDRDRKPSHYGDVWAEYCALGDERFRIKYYTSELHSRLRRIWTKTPAAGDLAVKRGGSNPHALKYSFENFGPIDIDGVDWGVFHEGDPPGWYCRALNPREGYKNFIGLHSLHGREDHEPFASSSLAFDGLHDFHGYLSPRAKPGRRKTP